MTSKKAVGAAENISGPAGGNQGAGELGLASSLIKELVPPVCGALGVIGLSGRAHYQDRLSGHLVEPVLYENWAKGVRNQVA